MGIQAHERQDELFDLRYERRQLLYALTLAICGGPPEQAAARVKLTEFARDPSMAKFVLASLEGAPESFTDADEIKAVAEHATAAPRLTTITSVRLN